MNNVIDLTGKVLFVTGAGGGIGKAICQIGHLCGATVIVQDIDGVAAQSVADELDGRVDVAVGDVSVELSVIAMIDDVIAKHNAIDVLINNAGLTAPHHDFLDVDMSEWRRIVDVNLAAPYLLSRYVAKQSMVPNHRGVILMTSSAMGERAMNYPETAYSVSKAALGALTRKMALQLGEFGIRVNAVAPGPVDAGMLKAILDEGGPSARQEVGATIPLNNQLAAPKDVAWMFAFLASDLARCVTGEVIKIDGGWAI